MMEKSTLYLAVASLALVIWIQHGVVVDRTVERDEAIEQRQAAEKAIVVLADERIEAERRKTAAAAGREAIVSVPEGNDPAVGESVRRALLAADEIGGVE